VRIVIDDGDDGIYGLSKEKKRIQLKKFKQVKTSEQTFLKWNVALHAFMQCNK